MRLSAVAEQARELRAERRRDSLAIDEKLASSDTDDLKWQRRVIQPIPEKAANNNGMFWVAPSKTKASAS